jgi:hypothetical protein
MAIRDWTESSFTVYVNVGGDELFSDSVSFNHVLGESEFETPAIRDFVKYAITRMWSENLTNAATSGGKDATRTQRLAQVKARHTSMLDHEIATERNSGLDAFTVMLRGVITARLMAAGLKTAAATKLAMDPGNAAVAYCVQKDLDITTAGSVLSKWENLARLDD